MQVGGTTGHDIGLADPAVARAYAQVSADWNATATGSYQPNLAHIPALAGRADNRTPTSRVHFAGGDHGPVPGLIRVFGSPISFAHEDADSGGADHAFSGLVQVSASEEISRVTVASAGTIYYGFSSTATTYINLYTDGNVASANATAEVSPDMMLLPVPKGAPPMP